MNRLTKHISLVLISSSLFLHGCEEAVMEKPTVGQRPLPGGAGSGEGQFGDEELPAEAVTEDGQGNPQPAGQSTGHAGSHGSTYHGSSPALHSHSDPLGQFAVVRSGASQFQSGHTQRFALFWLEFLRKFPQRQPNQRRRVRPRRLRVLVARSLVLMGRKSQDSLSGPPLPPGEGRSVGNCVWRHNSRNT